MEYKELLQIYRDQINTLDLELLSLLARRFEIVNQIWIIKKENNIQALQKDRWNELIEILLDEWIDQWINKNFIIDIWNRIHEESLKIEN